jgi:hypothetical protein
VRPVGPYAILYSNGVCCIMPDVRPHLRKKTLTRYPTPLLQGRVIPCDFIGLVKSQQSVYLKVGRAAGPVIVHKLIGTLPSVLSDEDDMGSPRQQHVH